MEKLLGVCLARFEVDVLGKSPEKMANDELCALAQENVGLAGSASFQRRPPRPVGIVCARARRKVGWSTQQKKAPCARHHGARDEPPKYRTMQRDPTKGMRYQPWNSWAFRSRSLDCFSGPQRCCEH
jgi:hypothetical protein